MSSSLSEEEDSYIKVITRTEKNPTKDRKSRPNMERTDNPVSSLVANFNEELTNDTFSPLTEKIESSNEMEFNVKESEMFYADLENMPNCAEKIIL